MYDVTIDAVVRGTGIWTGKRQPLEDKTFTWKHNALQNAEAQKYKKYEEGYANLSIGFLAFALSCFGVLGDSLVRFLFVLATVESKVLNDQRRQQGVPLLDGEDLSSVTAHNFQSSLARVSLAAMRATSARLTGRSSQPRVHPPPVQNTIRRQPHIADFVPSDLPRSP